MSSILDGIATFVVWLFIIALGLYVVGMVVFFIGIAIFVREPFTWVPITVVGGFLFVVFCVKRWAES